MENDKIVMELKSIENFKDAIIIISTNTIYAKQINIYAKCVDESNFKEIRDKIKGCLSIAIYPAKNNEVRLLFNIR